MPKKAKPETRKQFEAALRQLGFSRGQAKKICRSGFHPGGVSQAEIRAALETLRRSLIVSEDNDILDPCGDDPRSREARTPETSPPPASAGSPEQQQLIGGQHGR
jgi:hypothetical protein